MMKSFLNQFTSHRSAPEKEITRIYNLYKESFIKYYLTHSVDIIVLEDIYQESFLALHQAICTGRITDNSPTSLKRYLYGIGYKKLMKHFKQERQHTLAMEEFPVFMETDDSEEWAEQQKVVQEIVNQMKDVCKDVLSLFYWERKNMSEIAALMNYKNEDVAKNRKSICMRKLKEVLKERFRKENWI